MIVRLDCARTRELSTREDETRATAGLLEVGASTVSLVGVFYALGQASHLHGVERTVMTTAAMITIVLSSLLVAPCSCCATPTCTSWRRAEV